ncbi:MAG TPA: hypothetical protein VFR02_01885, partial [bacterium]|nr:hypothetical protein [bacterium]
MAGLWAASLGPWLLKNWVYTGNPLYPYFSGLLGGLRLPADRYAELLGNHESAFGTGMPFWRWPLEAWRHLDPTLAPPLLGFLPFLLLGAVFWKKERFLLSLAALSLAGGFLVSFQTRLMVPEMFLFLTAAGCFIGRWRPADKTTGGLGAAVAPRAWAAVLSLFGLLTLLSVARLTVQYDQSQLIWLGAQSRDAYLRACPQTASYYSLARACGWLPEGDRLLIIGDARALYYPRPFLVNSVYDVPLWTRIGRSSPDPAAVGEALRRLGVDDLVFSGEEQARMAGLYPADYALTPAQARVLDGFLEKRTQRVYQDGPRAIYRLKPPAAPRGKPG